MHPLSRLFSSIIDVVLPQRQAAIIVNETSPAQFASRAAFKRTGDIFAPFSYKDRAVQTLIIAAKFHGNTDAAAFLGKAAAYAVSDILIEECALLTDEALVVPIPLHPVRERERGYNQSSRIAEAFYPSIGIRSRMAPDVLIRVRNTKPQTKMENKYAREQNVFRAFEVPNAEGVRGRTIILLDDVTTTGSTLKDAARALKDAGASRVIMFAVAEA